MDFMQETENRQKKALTALLLGGRETETDEKAAEREQLRPEAVRTQRPAAVEAAAAEETLQSRRLAAQAEEYALLRRADALWRGEIGAAQGAEPVTFQPPRQTADFWDANAVSRLFQRDARRYDGSFRTD